MLTEKKTVLIKKFDGMVELLYIFLRNVSLN